MVVVVARLRRLDMAVLDVVVEVCACAFLGVFVCCGGVDRE